MRLPEPPEDLFGHHLERDLGIANVTGPGVWLASVDPALSQSVALWLATTGAKWMHPIILGV